MALKTVLVTGGVRSGKSSYGEFLAHKFEQVAYIATGWAGDQEMKERIKKHQKQRPAHWQTIEETLNLKEALIRANDKECILIDCLGMWVSNHLCQRKEGNFKQNLEDLLLAINNFSGTIILVTNEVGWGLVPSDKLSRDFRDILGFTNQRIAQVADELVLLVAGYPLYIKKKD